ncbi:MAG TPA: hypothetical protein ENK23_06310 [Sorangium sp.]|nr:hypothetical protein [Sorangium sp.]
MAKRDRPLYLLLFLQLCVTLATVAFVRWGVPPLRREHGRYSTSLPLLTQLGLLGWPLLTCAWAAFLLALGAGLYRGQRRLRLRVMSIALTISAVTFVVLAMACVSPLFQL